jgi:hypothetical protein
MSKSIRQTAAQGKAGHDPLTVEAVKAYLLEILAAGKPKTEPNPQARTFNVRVRLGLGEAQKLAYYARKANMSPGQWLANHAQCAVYGLKVTEENWEEIHAACVEVIRRTQPGRTVALKPEVAGMLREVAEFFGDGETPDNLLNEFYCGWQTPLDAALYVIGGLDCAESRRRELVVKAKKRWGGKSALPPAAGRASK